MRLLRALPWLCTALPLAAALDIRQQVTSTDTSASETATRHHTTLPTPITPLPSTQATTTDVSTTSPTSDPSDSGSSTDSSDNDGTPNTAAIDTDAAASGTGFSFNLSKGGLIAICVVVAFVVVFGVASLALWIVAKRRQWSIRASIRRASRRLTGRGNGGGPAAARSAADRQSKRAGLHMSTAPATRGHKRGVVVAVQDVEKGAPGRHDGDSTGGSGWSQKLLSGGRKK